MITQVFMSILTYVSMMTISPAPAMPQNYGVLEKDAGVEPHQGYFEGGVVGINVNSFIISLGIMMLTQKYGDKSTLRIISGVLMTTMLLFWAGVIMMLKADEDDNLFGVGKMLIMVAPINALSYCLVFTVPRLASEKYVGVLTTRMIGAYNIGIGFQSSAYAYMLTENLATWRSILIFQGVCYTLHVLLEIGIVYFMSPTPTDSTDTTEQDQLKLRQKLFAFSKETPIWLRVVFWLNTGLMLCVVVFGMTYSFDVICQSTLETSDVSSVILFYNRWAWLAQLVAELVSGVLGFLFPKKKVMTKLLMCLQAITIICHLLRTETAMMTWAMTDPSMGIVFFGALAEMSFALFGMYQILNMQATLAVASVGMFINQALVLVYDDPTTVAWVTILTLVLTLTFTLVLDLSDKFKITKVIDVIPDEVFSSPPTQISYV